MARRSNSHRFASLEDTATPACLTRSSPPAIRSFVHCTLSGLVRLLQDFVIGAFHIALEHRESLSLVSLEYIDSFDDAFEKSFHQLWILGDGLPQNHHAGVRVLDAKLVETS